MSTLNIYISWVNIYKSARKHIEAREISCKCKMSKNINV